MTSERIRAGLIAFFAGDALGAPWEGEPPDRIDGTRAPGPTSDDSAQTMLVARELVRSGGDPDPEHFLDALATALPRMRGAGRTSRAAVERWQAERTPTAPEGEGATNGGAMRALPIGFATAPGDVVRRRRMAEVLTLTTHGDPRALAAACAVAAMASYAVAAAPMFSIFAAGLEEAGAVVAGARESLTRAAVGSWRAPDDGVPFESLPTVAAVVSVLCHGEPSAGAAMRAAVALGGDTDTVAALAGGIAAARAGGLDGVDWLDDVDMPVGDDELDDVAAGLRALRG